MKYNSTYTSLPSPPEFISKQLIFTTCGLVLSIKNTNYSETKPKENNSFSRWPVYKSGTTTYCVLFTSGEKFRISHKVARVGLFKHLIGQQLGHTREYSIPHKITNRVSESEEKESMLVKEEPSVMSSGGVF